jgi:F420H(2)-dependent quinone reductase
VRYREANPIQRFMRWSAATAPMSWLYVRVLHHIDRPIYRLTRGRHTLVSLVSGLPVVMLTTTGAKTGQQRVWPVLGLPDGTTWWRLRPTGGSAIIPPGTTISAPIRRSPSPWAVSPGASGPMRPWVRSGSACGDGDWRSIQGWAAYERRVTHRRIPVMVLAPATNTNRLT